MVVVFAGGKAEKTQELCATLEVEVTSPKVFLGCRGLTPKSLARRALDRVSETPSAVRSVRQGIQVPGPLSGEEGGPLPVAGGGGPSILGQAHLPF